MAEKPKAGQKNLIWRCTHRPKGRFCKARVKQIGTNLVDGLMDYGQSDFTFKPHWQDVSEAVYL